MNLAEESYRRGLAARPKLHVALHDLSTFRLATLVEAKDPHAVARAEELAAEYPKSPDASALLGSAQTVAGNEAEARSAIAQAAGSRQPVGAGDRGLADRRQLRPGAFGRRDPGSTASRV
jgi:hypothetical protein